MRETLYIRLRAAEPTAPTSYCIAASDAVASYPVDTAPLDFVLRHAAGRRLVVLVPAADIRVAGVQLPAKQVSKALKAVPYALEDQLAEDVETLHFALGTRQADGHWPVAVIARERIDAWLAFFAAHGIRPDAMIPDVLALPSPADGQFSMLIDGDDIIVRTAVDGGFVCSRDDLDLCLGIADPGRTHALRMMISRDENFDPSTLGRPVEPLHGFSAPLEALLLNLSWPGAIDLLQGDYSVQQDLLKLWRPWQATAALMLIVLTLGIISHAVAAHRLGSELARQDAENVRRYQQVFPSETRIVNLQAQLDQQLARTNGQGSQAGLLPLLSVAAAAGTSVPDLTVQSLQFHDGALYVAYSAKSLQSLEKLKNWFASNKATSMEVQSANSGADGVQIRIKLSPA